MRAVYQSVRNRIIDLISQAEKTDRAIEYIVLSREEWKDLKSEMDSIYEGTYAPVTNVLGMFHGVTLVNERYHELKIASRGR